MKDRAFSLQGCKYLCHDGWKEGKIFVLNGKVASSLPSTVKVEVIDLPGSYILPGFIDSHGHIFSLGTNLVHSNLRNAKNIGEVINTLKSSEPEGNFLIGHGWDHNFWAENRLPHRNDLDSHFPHLNVILHRRDGHCLWVNSNTLKSAGITSATKDPDGGLIIRDENGPTGILLDNAMNIILSIIPKSSGKIVLKRLSLACKELANKGIWGACDMSLTREEIEAFISLDSQKLLPIFVRGYILGNNKEAFNIYDEYKDYNGDRFAVSGIKFFADGALGSRGAALIEEYTDSPGEKGLFLMDKREMEEAFILAHNHGVQCAIHSIGDAAISQVLGILERLKSSGKVNPAGWRVEHLQIASRADLMRIKSLGLFASIQGIHYIADKKWAIRRLGKQRWENAYRQKSVRDERITICSGSDFPVEDHDPIKGIYAFQDRENKERLPLKEILFTYTENGAIAGKFGSLGRIAEGRDAYFTILHGSLTKEDRFKKLIRTERWHNGF